MHNFSRRVIKNSSFLLFFLVLPLQSFAQKHVKDSVNLDELIVTGSKKEISRKVVPLSVSQISRSEIESTGQVNILPALNYFVPGIFVTERNILGFGVSTGGSGSISIRGVGGSPNNEVLVLIDGHPQFQGLFGHPLADAYTASDVEKVEIIRGPASLLYGSNAMGGVINIITKKQYQEGLRVGFGAAYGSYNTQKLYETIGYKKGKFSIFSSLNHDQTDGIRPHTDFNISNGYLKTAYRFDDHFNLTADVNIATFIGNDNGSVYAAPAPFGADITRGKAALSLENKFEKWEGALKLYHNFGVHTLTDGFHSTDRNSGIMLYQSINLFQGNTLTAGTDLTQYGGIANQGLKHDSLLLVNDMAIYATMQQTLFKKLTLTAGLRLEHNSIYGNELVPLGGITYSPTAETTFKASVSKGFRDPTLMELYLYVPNPALQPERVMNYEIGWLQSLLNNTLNLELTTYKLVGDNMIQVAGIFPAIQRMNTGSFVNTGIEFSAKYAVTNNLFLHANYSYLDLSKAIIAAPRQQMNVSANYRYKMWDLNASAQYIEKLYTFISPNPTVAPVIEPNYLLLNVRLSVRPLKQLELFADGNNLLNQQYQINYGYPMPGINFNVGFNVSL